MVAPKIRKKANSPKDKTILILLNHFIPLPIPDNAEAVEHNMTTASATSNTAVVGLPSVTSHSAPVIL